MDPVSPRSTMEMTFRFNNLSENEVGNDKPAVNPVDLSQSQPGLLTTSKGTHEVSPVYRSSKKLDGKFCSIIQWSSRFFTCRDVQAIKAVAQISAWKFFCEASLGIGEISLNIPACEILDILFAAKKSVGPDQSELLWRNYALQNEKQVPSLIPRQVSGTQWCEDAAYEGLPQGALPMVQLHDGRFVIGNRCVLELWSKNGNFDRILQTTKEPIHLIKLLADGRVSMEYNKKQGWDIQSMDSGVSVFIPKFDYDGNSIFFHDALLPPKSGFVAMRRRNKKSEIVWLKPDGSVGSVCERVQNSYRDDVSIVPLFNGEFAVQFRGNANRTFVCKPSLQDNEWEISVGCEGEGRWNQMSKPLLDGRLIISTEGGKRHFWNPTTGEVSQNFGVHLPQNQQAVFGEFYSLSDGRIIETNVLKRPKWLWSSTGDLLGSFTYRGEFVYPHSCLPLPLVLEDHCLLFTCTDGKRYLFFPSFSNSAEVFPRNLKI